MAYDMYTGKKISTGKSAQQCVASITKVYMEKNLLNNPRNLDESLDIVLTALEDFGGVQGFADQYAWNQRGIKWWLVSRFSRIVTWYAIRKTAIKLGFQGYKGLLA